MEKSSWIFWIGLKCNHVVLVRGMQEGRHQRRRYDERSRSGVMWGHEQGMWAPLGARKGKEMDSSLEPPEGTQSCQTLSAF